MLVYCFRGPSPQNRKTKKDRIYTLKLAHEFCSVFLDRAFFERDFLVKIGLRNSGRFWVARMILMF